MSSTAPDQSALPRTTQSDELNSMDDCGSVEDNGEDELNLTDDCGSVEYNGPAWVRFIARQRATSSVYLASSEDPPGLTKSLGAGLF